MEKIAHMDVNLRGVEKMRIAIVADLYLGARASILPPQQLIIDQVWIL